MAMQKKSQPAAALSPAGTAPVGVPPVTAGPPGRLTHRVSVAISLVLIAAAIGQTLAWQFHLRVVARTGQEIVFASPSSVVANDVLFDGLSRLLHAEDGLRVPTRRFLFRACLLLAFASTVAWYAGVRLLLGPGWALACAIAWAIHPLFLFTAQQSNPLSLSLFATPAALAQLLWWGRERHRRIAFLAGLGAGLAALVSVATGVAVMLGAPLALAAGRFNRKAWQGLLLVWLGLSIPLLAAWMLSINARIPNPTSSYAPDLLANLDRGEAPVTVAVLHDHLLAREDLGPAALLKAAGQGLVQSPRQWIGWLGARIWACSYATTDGRLQRALFFCGVATLLPASWGALALLRNPHLRWLGLACLLTVLCHWVVAAIADPLARSLAPVGGILTGCALYGLAGFVQAARRRWREPLGPPNPARPAK